MHVAAWHQLCARVEIDGGLGQQRKQRDSTVSTSTNVPAFVEMDATFSRFSKTVETTIEITPLADVTSNNLALFAVIYSHRDTANVKTNGETEFISIVKKMMPSSSGQSIASLTQERNNADLELHVQRKLRIASNANSPG